MVSGMGAAGQAARDARDEALALAAKRARDAEEHATARRDAAKTLASMGGLYVGHKVHEGTHAVLHTYREFDKERHFAKAVMGLTDEQQEPLIEQAIHMGASTKYNDVQVLEAQRELAARGLKRDSVMGLMSPAANLGMSLDLSLPAAVRQMEGAIFGFKKPIATLEEAMASAKQTADVQVKAAKISGMTPEDISQTYTYGAQPAQMAGLSEQTLLAFGAMSKKANMGGDQAGTAFRALVANALSPTRKAKEAMLANGFDYKNYQRNPDKIDTEAFKRTVAAQYGVQLDKSTTQGLDKIFTDKKMIADPSKFTPAVLKLLSDNLGGDDAKSKKSIAGLANRFRDSSMRGVDANAMVGDLMKAIVGNPAFANAFFGSKQGARIANALGNPEEFRHMLDELLGHSEGYSEKIAKERMSGFDGAMSRLEGSIKNLETAAGRAFDDGGKGGFLTHLTDAAAHAVQGLAELPRPALAAAGALAWLGGKIATGAGTLGLIGAAISLRASATALTAAAGRLALGGAAGGAASTAAGAAAGGGVLAAASAVIGGAITAGTLSVGALVGAKLESAEAVNEGGLPALLRGEETPTARIARELAEAQRKRGTVADLDERIAAERATIERLTAPAPEPGMLDRVIGKLADIVDGDAGAERAKATTAEVGKAEARIKGLQAERDALTGRREGPADQLDRRAVRDKRAPAPEAAPGSAEPPRRQVERARGPADQIDRRVERARLAPAPAAAPGSAEPPRRQVERARGPADQIDRQVERARLAPAPAAVPGLTRGPADQGDRAAERLKRVREGLSALDAQTVAPKVDTAGLDQLDAKSDQTKGKLAEITAATVKPDVDASGLDALIAKGERALAILRQVASAATGANASIGRVNAAAAARPAAAAGSSAAGSSAGLNVRGALSDNFA
ncbi:phage tail tape measure protein [Methylobacterium sp. WSM2598]|uniref:phage tail tape measure protein n=1 Tax=Methylobacterium sp. WSM2598 TaxID=398261 RepID=UPI001AEC4FBA|nr:phage tail tape measure protein [Methylobacterium sp. WSM2598]